MDAGIRPSERQSIFLSSPADIAIFGGAAGGGKTYALLLEPTRHIDNRDFNSVIFRRTYPEITQSGGIWEDSGKIYPSLGAAQHLGNLEWSFPSGATVRFAHIQYESDLNKYLGAQIALIAFDQLELFSEKMFFYMLSRNRSTSGVRPYMRATCNPDADVWLADFLSWWIAEDGYADLSRSGVIRWFVRGPGEEILWGDTKEELTQQYPNLMPKSVTFVHSSVYDNAALLETDPGYLANLMSLPKVERERLLGDPERGGNWKIRAEAGKVFNRAWYDVVHAQAVGGVVCRFWDFAATEEKQGRKPSSTAGVRMRMTDQFYVEDVTVGTWGPAETMRVFISTTLADLAELAGTGVTYLCRWEEEPGSASKRESYQIRLMLAHAIRDAGINVAVNTEGVRSERDKFERAKPFSQFSEVGAVQIVAGTWNNTWLAHMHNQPSTGQTDVMDATAGAFNTLAFGDYGEKIVVDDSIRVSAGY